MQSGLLLERLLLIFSSSVLFVSCSSKDSGGSGMANPCDGVTIVVSGTTTNTSGAGMSNGSITASATGGTNFQFSINGAAFQSSGNFIGLSAGNYTIVAKDSRGCSGSKSFTITDNDPCASVSFSVSGTPSSATPCVTPANGSIIVTTNGGGTGFTYNLNGGAYQASAVFNNLVSGNYTVGAKESGGCVKTASVVVNATPAGTLFSTVKSIINSNCALSGCHIGATPTGGIDFSQDCQIVANKDRIKLKAVDSYGTSQQMPPPPNAGLSQANRDAIVNWINAGGEYSN